MKDLKHKTKGPRRFLRGLPLALALVTASVGVSAGMADSVYAADASYTTGPYVFSDAYCVMDADTGDVLFGKNAMSQYFPASITKVLTALIVCEQVEDFDAVITFSDSAVNGIAANSSTMTPKGMVGEQMTVWDVLNGMMLCSANECAAMLAEYVAGSQEAFADLMNEKVRELGCTNSHFMNAHGLDHPNHYVTAYDMCLIFRAAMENEKFREIDTSLTYTIPATNMNPNPRVLTMSHPLMSGEKKFEGVIAGKTGRTANAGRTLVTYAQHNGRNLIVVTLLSNDENFAADTSILLEYAYLLVDGQEAWNWEEVSEEKVAKSACNLRVWPTTYSRVSGSLAAGQKVTVNARYANWSRMEIDGLTYYASSDFLQYPDGTPSPITTETTAAETSEAADESRETSDPTESIGESGDNSSETVSEENMQDQNEEDLSGESTEATETVPASMENGDGNNSGRAVRDNRDHRSLYLVLMGVVTSLAVITVIVYFVLLAKSKKRVRQSKRVHRDN